MSRPPFAPGDVITYPYRWVREQMHQAAPDGAKDRPCCVVLQVADADGREVIFLAAISSKAPLPEQAAIAIPDTERRRAGLTRHPQAWIYIGELNRDEPARSWYLEPQTPMGSFSKPFLATIARALREQVRRVRVVRRR